MMSEEKSSTATAPPAGYGTVSPPLYPPPGAPPPTAPDGVTIPLEGGYPNEPPPKYEAPVKEGYQQGVTAQQIPAHQTIIVTDITWGPNPRVMECPHCHALMSTQVTYQAGALTWLAAGLICLFGCWAGCCLIPFCITDMQDAYHRCPNCGQLIGVYSRL